MKYLPYYILGIVLTAFTILFWNLHISLWLLAVLSLILGYIVGIIFSSISGFMEHCWCWFFNIQNYRYAYKTSKTLKKRAAIRLRIFPFRK
ncbi:MAG: hypothetical protein JSS78_09535 [Bacteroidetes bacterium]|nr:hypothetical protein [Bacteroidota bacterium]